MDRTTAGVMTFEEFYAVAAPSLRRLAAARTGSWAAAEDLVQDAMADAFRRWDTIGGYDDATAWARRAVLNRTVSRWRRRDREHRALARLAGRPGQGADDPGDLPALADTELWAAIRSLSPRQLEVVLLLWFEQLSVDEVAATIDCGPETVRTHWRRARAHLADALGEPHDEPFGTDEEDPT